MKRFSLKKLVAIAAFVTLGVLDSSSAFPAQSYTITDLGNLGPYRSWAINDSPQVVGQLIDGSLEHVGFLWENGTITILKTKEETLYEPHDIYNAGVVAGQGREYGGGGSGQAYVWENGVIQLVKL